MPIPTEPVSDVELIEHLDFNVKALCEVMPCLLEATWVCRAKCCGSATLCCETHKEGFATVSKDFRLRVLALKQGFQCRSCLTVHRDFEWIEFIPIGSGS